MWLLVVSCLVALYLLISFLVRPSVGLAIVVPLSWLIPAWVRIDVGIEMLDMKTATTIIALSLYCFLPRATFPWQLVPCDFAIIGLVAVHLLSDLWNGSPYVATIAIAYVEWVMPYLAGRLAFQQRENVPWIWPTIGFLAIFLIGFASFEAYTRVNLYESVFGLRPLEGVSRDAMRWGFHRAYVVCFHPLYQGVLFCWLFGMLLYSAWRGLTGRSNILWILGAPIGMVAPLITGSRGPFLGTLVVLLMSIFCYYKTLRVTIVVVGIAIAIGLLFAKEPILNVLDNWSGETSDGRQLKKLNIRDNVDSLSSARARLTLFKIYWVPLTRAGLLGYGTDAVSTFPPNIPTGSNEVEAMQDIWSVDNTYILMTLRFGYLGLLSFMWVAGTSLFQLMRVKDNEPRNSLAVFIACLFGSITAVLVLIFAVWMPADFGFPLLWSFGASSGLYHETFRAPARLIGNRKATVA